MKEGGKLNREELWFILMALLGFVGLYVWAVSA